MMRILVSGATGYIGQHLVRALESAGHDVTKVGFRAASSDPDIVRCDIANAEELAQFVCGHDMVVHLACLALPACIESPEVGFNVNVAGTNNVAMVCARLKVKLLMVSTSEVYGRQDLLPIKECAVRKPVSIYGGYKLLAEQCCENWKLSSGLSYAIVRLFNIYGPAANGEPRNTVETIFLRRALSNAPLIVKGRENSRDFLYVGDAIAGLLMAIENFKAIEGCSINLARGIETSLENLALQVCSVIGYEPGHLLKLEDSETTVRFQADISASRNLLGFEPKVSLEQGLQIIRSSLH